MTTHPSDGERGGTTVMRRPEQLSGRGAEGSGLVACLRRALSSHEPEGRPPCGRAQGRHVAPGPRQAFTLRDLFDGATTPPCLSDD